MPVTYTNRKGVTYQLCRGTTKTGKPRYFFARKPQGEVVLAIPAGYHIEESVNGVVSLAKDRPQFVAPEEVGAVEAALKRHPDGGNYRVALKGEQIIVYEGRGTDLGGMRELLARFGRAEDHALIEALRRDAHYTPILRFVLHDRDRRLFTAYRWHFSGSIDDWVEIGYTGRLERLARDLIPVLGTDAYFDLH